MRIGSLCEPNSAANYRVKYALQAMQTRGHEVVWYDAQGRSSFNDLRGCDVVLVYRIFGHQVYAWLARLKREGVGIVWDNDDDFLNMPKSRKNRRNTGLSHPQIFSEMVKVAKLAHAVILTVEPLADFYRKAGVPAPYVIENYLWPEPRKPRVSGALTVGWIAGTEHRTDAIGLRLTEALRQLQAKYQDLIVTTVGVDLPLQERYRHSSGVPFDQLPDVMATFDIGIAPILDTPFNRSRSNIKVKEYAASGIPWLASACGPYARLGEHEGGRLVPDDGWYDALDALIGDPAARDALSAAGTAWAKTQTIDAVTAKYEALFADVVERATGRPAAMPVASRLVGNARAGVAAGDRDARPGNLVARLPSHFVSRPPAAR
jgi:glycosyltransferase involved in cell wall biosynthesis